MIKSTLLGLVLSCTNPDFLVENLSTEQIHTLHYAYTRGEPHGLGYTLAAITWVESTAGINLKSPTGDFGPYGINITTASNRLERKDTYVLQKELTNNPELGADMALSELEFWVGVYGNNYDKVLSSYNSGWNWKYGFKYYLPKIKEAAYNIRNCLRME